MTVEEPSEASNGHGVVPELMASVRQTAALAARLGHDSAYSAQLIEAARAGNDSMVHALIHSCTGGFGTVNFTLVGSPPMPASVHVGFGRVHITFDVHE